MTVFSRVQRDSISHYVGLSVGRSVPHLLFWQFASSLRITAPAQPHAIKVVVYTAPHSAPALPPTAPAPPAPRRGAHRSCPTEREQFLHYCPCPINWNRCCRVYSTSSPLLPIIYCPCPTARDLCRVVYPALFQSRPV